MYVLATKAQYLDLGIQSIQLSLIAIWMVRNIQLFWEKLWFPRFADLEQRFFLIVWFQQNSKNILSIHFNGRRIWMTSEKKCSVPSKKLGLRYWLVTKIFIWSFGILSASCWGHYWKFNFVVVVCLKIFLFWYYTLFFIYLLFIECLSFY